MTIGEGMGGHRPTVAIVGRPNVGKYSLFNVIVGRRLAIVHEMSGVTRDRVAAPVRRNGRLFTLIDTGGLGMLDGESKHVDMWDANIARQVEAAILDADVLVMVGDAEAGVTPLDRDVAARLRATGKKVLLAVNKCDNDEAKNHAVEFSELGFGSLFPICCLHRGGVNALLDRVLAELPAPAPEETELSEVAIRIAVIGRPNVGKSSLVNALIGEERVMTSPVAGTTRDAVDVEFSIDWRGEKHRALLVDTAGLRKRAKVDTVVEYFSAMRAKSAIERSDLVIMVVEAGPGAGGGVTAQDRKIADEIEKSGKGCVIAANKLDLLPAGKTQRKNVIDELRRNLPGLSYAPLVGISAAKRQGMEELLDAVAAVMEHLELEIPTGVLNRVLHRTFESLTPPVVGTAPLKFFYASMVGIKPPRVKLFVNNPACAAPHYITYLAKQIRNAFDLDGVPLRMELCARPKNVESIRRNAAKRRK